VGNVPSWVLGGRVRQIWFGEGLALVVQAAAHEEAQELMGVVQSEEEGGDWSFAVEPSLTSAVDGGEGTFWLCLFDSKGMRYDELPCERGTGGRVRALDVADRAERLAGDGGLVRWALEQRVNGVTVARSRAE